MEEKGMIAIREGRFQAGTQMESKWCMDIKGTTKYGGTGTIRTGRRSHRM